MTKRERMKQAAMLIGVIFIVILFAPNCIWTTFKEAANEKPPFRGEK